jgi:hypothetical protein
MTRQKQITTLIKSMSGQANILTIPRIYISITGDINSALLLSQAVYWSDKTGNPEGWFYKSYPDWQEEIGLTQYQVKRAAVALQKLGVMETDLRKVNRAPTVHYLVLFDPLYDLIMKKLDNQETSLSTNLINEKLDNRLSRNLIIDYEETSLSSLTEITTETTTEIKTTAALADSPISFSPDIQAEKIFQQVTGWVTFPGSEQANAIAAIRTILAVKCNGDSESAVTYLKRFFDAFKERYPQSTRCFWLTDWAVTDKIPEKKKAERTFTSRQGGLQAAIEERKRKLELEE